MPEDATKPDLRHQALLYAAGELEPAQADAFENRLRDDPQAQEALIQAVQLNLLIEGTAADPSAAYRERVRAAARQGFGSRWFGRYRIPSVVFWSLCGGCAAVLCFLVWSGSRLSVPATPPRAEPTAVARTIEKPLPLPAAKEPAASDEASDEADGDDMLGMAETWAELTNCDHLQKVVEDENRRKARSRLRLDDFKVHRALDTQREPH